MDKVNFQILANLIGNQQIASLGTLHDGAPYVSMVLYSPCDDFGAYDFHLSRLSAHTRDLLQDGRASLMVAEPDLRERDPQTLARLTLFGSASELPGINPESGPARSRYLSRFPQADPLFAFKDFAMFRFIPDGARFVAGFARAFNLSVGQLKQAVSLLSKE